MWCKTCNKIIYDDICPTCGGIAQEDIPTEVYWCEDCNVPIIKEVSDIDKDVCPLCGATTKYMCADKGMKNIVSSPTVFIDKEVNTDTQTVHSHIIVNAVHPITGKKLQFSQKDYVAMKDEVNRIGKEHGFTATEFRKRGKNSRTAPERKIMLNGGTSWKEELREVIVEAIKNSTTPDKFKEYLEKCYGVKITRDGKDYSYLHPEKQKPIRGEKLGTNYTKSEVLRKIGKQNNGEKSGPFNGRRSGFNGQPASAGVVRGSKTSNGASAGRIVNASLVGIEREMQRLDFDAKCANCGTDAASEERRMAERAAREESERRLKEIHERREREQREVVERPESNVGQDNDNGIGDRTSSKYSYGKGD